MKQAGIKREGKSAARCMREREEKASWNSVAAQGEKKVRTFAAQQ